MNILFLCTGNSCRSQMAEGWGRSLSNSEHQFQSAGIEAHGKNPRAIDVMSKFGVDISGQNSTIIDQDMINEVDIIVTVCGHADEHCPVIPANITKIHWPLSDPAKATGSEVEIQKVFEETCLEIKHRVESLLKELG